MKQSASEIEIGSLDPGIRLWIRSNGFILIGVVALPIILHGLNNIRGISDTGFLAGNYKLVDWATWGASLAVCAALMVAVAIPRSSSSLHRNMIGWMWSCLVIAGIGIGIVWIEPFMNYRGHLWFGFGYQVLIMSIASLLLVWWLISEQPATILRFIGVASAVFIPIVYLPLLVQPIWGLMEYFHSEYVFNEILAPAVGNYPLAGHVPQYTVLLGYPLIPFLRIIPELTDLVNPGLMVSAYLSALAILTIVLLTYLVFKVLPWGLRSLALLFTVPLVLVKQQPPETILGAITTLFSAVPIRTLPVVVMGIALVALRPVGLISRFICVGMIGGLAALNNFEFGVPTLIAGMLVTAAKQRSFQRSLVAVLAVGIIGVSIPVGYILLLLFLGQEASLENWVVFVRFFAAGFGNVPMPVVGTHVLVLMVLISGAILGWFTIHRSVSMPQGEMPDDSSNAGSRVIKAGTAMMFFGLAGLGSFGYYVARSVTAGQLQIFLFFLAPVIAASLTVVRMPTVRQSLTIGEIGALMAFLLPAGLSIAAVVQGPDPAFEWNRVMKTTKISDVPYEQYVSKVVQLRNTTKDLFGINEVAVALRFGNYIAARVGIRNVSVFDRPEDLNDINSPEAMRKFCQGLSKTGMPIIVKGDLMGEPIQKACPGYLKLGDLGEGYYLLERIR